MRWNTFGRSAVFAAVAGCGVMPWLFVAAPLLGVRGALSVYLVAATAAYVTGMAPSLRRGFGAGIFIMMLGGPFAALAHALPELALGLAVLLAVARTGLVYRTRSPRAVAVEIGLVAAGLLFARFLAGSSLISVMLALWGFFLVQSVFFLLGGRGGRDASAARADPFVAACERANALLDGLAI